MTKDNTLRRDRLVFYARDVDRIDAQIDGFLELSGARCALLIDKDGHLVTRRGEPVQGSLDSVSALIAGSFAATREMARLFGEETFSNLFHQGARDCIQVSLVGDRSLFVIVFDDRTNLGLVRFYSDETVKQLAEIIASLAERGETHEERLSVDFSSSAAAALDKIL